MIPSCKKIINDSLKKELLDMFYPIGSYYESSDPNFNPNTAWGGVWQEDSKGRTTIGAGECDDEEARFYTLGQKIGSSTQWLTSENQLPKHRHTVDITTKGGTHGHGIFVNNGQSNKDWGLLFEYRDTAALNTGGMSGVDGDHTHRVQGNTDYVGKEDGDGLLGFSIIQSSIVVKRWHRIS